MKTIRVTSAAGFDKAVAEVCHAGTRTDADRVIAEKIESTRAIVSAVRELGDDAVADYTKRFDGADLTPEQFEVTPAEIDAAVASVDAELISALKRAHENIKRFHEKFLRQSWEEKLEDGTVLGQRITPIASAGVYVPGGKAFYPSSKSGSAE